MDTAIAIAVDPSSYSQKLEGCVICVEDRLYPNGQRKQAPRLAGGALALGLMRNLIFGGALLSQDLQELRSLGLYVALHDDCGALRLAPELIPAELSHINAGGYRLLEALGLRIPMLVRQRIAEWARRVPKDYVDTAAAMQVVNEVEPTVGTHNAVLAAVSLVSGESFVAGPRLFTDTGGLTGFAFDPWVAERDGHRIAVSQDDAAAAAALAQVFTAQVLLTLGGQDLQVVLHR